MSVTIKEIAAMAGVSRGTVDKVLNNRPGVKQETKEKVLQIAKKMNYQPNFLGKALVQSKDPIKLGIILTPEYNPYIQEIIKGINEGRNEFSAFGLEIITKKLKSLDPFEQLSIIEELIAENVQGLAVFPLNNARVIDCLNTLIKENIAIVTFNSKVSGCNDLCFVGQDHYKGGRTAAGLMGRICNPDASIGVIISSMHLSCHQDRLMGFREKLMETYPNIKIVEIQENQDRGESAYQITKDYLKKYPDLQGIYLTSGGIFGIAQALEEAGKSSDIRVICHDVIDNTVELLSNGTVDFAIGQNPTQQGYLLVKTLFDYLIKRQTPDKIIDIPIQIFTDEAI